MQLYINIKSRSYRLKVKTCKVAVTFRNYLLSEERGKVKKLVYNLGTFLIKSDKTRNDRGLTFKNTI